MGAVIKAFLILGALLFPACTDAQRPVKWSTETPGRVATGRPGRVVPVRIGARIDRGWYLYSITQPVGGPLRTQIWVPAGQLFSQAGNVTGPTPETGLDRVFNIRVEKYRRAAEFVLPVRIPPNTKPGRHPIEIHIRYQACNDKVCLSPTTVKLSRTMLVTS